MDLRIKPPNEKSHVPVHVQLKEQLKHLVLSGELGIGERLPSIRMLAGFLRINRNTVARVVTDLEREGFIETRRGSGSYVVEPRVGVGDMKRQRLLEWVMEEAEAEGVSVEELGYELLARAGTASSGGRIALVECNRHQVEQFSAELEERLPVAVDGMLLEELRERTGEELPWRLVATTFFHVQEVEELLEPHGVETVALLAEATVGTLRRLADLNRGTVVGVVGNSPACAENLLRSLEGAGLDHLELEVVYDYRETEKVRDLLGRVRAVVCGSVVAGKLPEIGAPPGLEVIVEDRTLDRSGIDMLGRMLR